ncbi:FAD binding domain containing [Pyrenophora seminiperda CCB06]|uniref:FAD binding domain containing n=1 Tax=Pyrenophora seminiperda CCB06 TaxID=1302712 RepID=A0A3M7LVC3_9PLEO|nr:FAD binding domain containing [Pyrenophora seminiperda CCB06]
MGRKMANFILPLMTAVALAPFTQMDYCCTVLSLTSLKPHLLYLNTTAYTERVESYFDIKQQDLRPNCIVQPKTAHDVSLIVKTLTAASRLKNCKFAIRSAGHTPHAGASNIGDGVTIDLQYLSAVTYDPQSSLVSIGPAANWGDVYKTLEPHGVMATGGRASTVGVAGLILGGGISHFSPEYGLVCDNVVEFEVVLADGDIVTASMTENHDLFTVLKGGNNNFGVVTDLKMRTFKYNGMWGGLVLYPGDAIQGHFEALVKFSNGVGKEPKGAVIVMPMYTSAVGADLVLNAYDYAEPIPRPAIYDEFLMIKGNVSDSTGIRNMSSLAGELAALTTHRIYFGTLTFVNDIKVMKKAHEIYLDVLSNLKAKATGDWAIYTLYQPLPPAYWRESAARGGNVLGLERFGEQVLCLYQPYIMWQGSQQDELFQAAGAELVRRVSEYSESIDAANPYLYLNYADITQDPLASYGAEAVKKMKAAARKYDPSGVFQKLVPGGFKVSNIQ